MKNSEKKMTAEEALKILEAASGKDFYTVEYQDALNVALDALREKTNPAHWIFSGDIDDYDGYYMNCSKCGSQRKAYDRNYDLDVPVACPHCGTAMNHDAASWEVEEVYHVSVLYNTGAIVVPYISDIPVKSEEEAREKAIKRVASMFPDFDGIEERLSVDFVEKR